jgi:hypothetical protein
VFPIKNSKPDDWSTCEENIVALVQNIIIDRSATKKAIPAKHPYRYNVKNIFVKHIGDEVCVSSIGLSTMAEE